jgi:hypothetical protein
VLGNNSVVRSEHCSASRELKWRFSSRIASIQFKMFRVTDFLRDPKEQVYSYSNLKTETDPVSETLCFLAIWNSGRWTEFLLSCPLTKSPKIKVCNSLSLPTSLYGFETSSFPYGMNIDWACLRIRLWCKRERERERELEAKTVFYNKLFHNLYCSTDSRIMISRRIRWERHWEKNRVIRSLKCWWTSAGLHGITSRKIRICLNVLCCNTIQACKHRQCCLIVLSQTGCGRLCHVFLASGGSFDSFL